MAAVHDGGIGEDKQLPLDAGEQRVDVAARQVRAADGPLKQHVAREHHAVAHETHAPGRVPRGVPDGKGQPAHPHVVAVREGVVGRRHLLRAEPEGFGLLRYVVVEEPVGWVEKHRRPRFGGDAPDAQHVIEVGMGEPHGDRPRAGRGHVLENETGLLARIDDGALARLLVDHEVAVLEKSAVGDLHDLHEAAAAFVFAFSCSRRAARYFSTAIAAVVASPTAVVT